jgi:hypothetical protein
MDEYAGGDHIYAPVNAGPIGPDGVPKVGTSPPVKPGGETADPGETED